MFQICLQIGQSSIAQILDFMLVRNSTTSETWNFQNSKKEIRKGFYSLDIKAILKCSIKNEIKPKQKSWKFPILGMVMGLKNQQFGIVDIPLLKILLWYS